MKEAIQNRDEFLAKLAGRLGRDKPARQIEKPQWSVRPQYKVLPNATPDELVAVLKNQCLVIHTDLIETDLAGLRDALQKRVVEYGGSSVVAWQDKRFQQWGLSPLFETIWPSEDMKIHQWDASLGEENIRFAEQANIGITISDLTLAESGTAVLFNSTERGRTVSFLPNHSIILIPKSTIVPRMTQAAELIRSKINNGETLASCINFITGPSNSADIEMILVVGVHGPVKATYIVIDDV